MIAAAADRSVGSPERLQRIRSNFAITRERRIYSVPANVVVSIPCVTVVRPHEVFGSVRWRSTTASNARTRWPSDLAFAIDVESRAVAVST